MYRPQGPFQTAFLTVFLAIAIPLVLLMFGGLRHRQLQSKANPRWAQFAQISGPGSSPLQNASESRRVSVRTASIRTEDPVIPEPVHINPAVPTKSDRDLDLSPSFTGSVSGHTSVEFPVRQSERKSAATPQRAQPQNDYDPDDHSPIVFRPAEDECNSQLAQSVERHESQLKDMHHRLGRLALQQQEQGADEVERETGLLQRETKFLGQLKQLNQALADETVAREAAILKTKKWVTENLQATVSQMTDELPATGSQSPEEPKVASPIGDVADSPQMKQPHESPRVPPQAQSKSEPPAKSAEPSEDVFEAPDVNRTKSHTAESVVEDEPFEAPPAAVMPPEAPHSPTAQRSEQDAYDDKPVVERPVVPTTPGVTDDGPIVPAVRSPDDTVRIYREQGTESTDQFTMIARDADIRLFLNRLSDVAQVSILPSPGVEGSLSLSLHNVSWEKALKAIVKSRGYICERDDDIITISTADEVARLKQQNRTLELKIYHPNYLPVAELNRLIEPLLSSDGRRSVTRSAACEAKSCPGARGDEISPREAVIVQDVAEVHRRIDQILVDMDLPPLQVTIEAKILCVRLSGRLNRGIDLDQLPCHPRSATALAEGGLKHASLSCNVPAFIQSVERLADTSVVTSQRIQVLNRHRAEMLIGDRIGYQCCPGGRIVGMEAGTRLIFRPSISADGYVRMDIHPERSTMSSTGCRQPIQTTAELTTSVLVRDGATVVIGGLIAQQAIETTRQVPLVGSLPVLGAPFRKKQESLQRTELVILVTPHIVTECEAVAEGLAIEQATESRAAEFRDRQHGVARHNLARAHYERATCYFKQGNLVKARQQVEASLTQNKTDLKAIQLRNQIEQCLHQTVGR